METEEESEEEDELKTDLLSRTSLPEDVRFESVWVGGVEYTRGAAEVEVTPLGLLETVEFELSLNDERCRVVWDAVTGGTRVETAR